MANPELAKALNAAALQLSDYINKLQKQQDGINAEIKICYAEMEKQISDLGDPSETDNDALREFVAAISTKIARVKVLRAQHDQLSGDIGQARAAMVSLSNLAASLSIK